MQLTRRTFMAAAAASALTAAAARAEDPKKYRACIIGDSQGGGYGHDFHQVFALQPRVEVVALADPDEAGRAKFAAEAGAPRTYADYREMLEKEKPDIVAVGPRWTTRHREYVLACADAGAHGFLEKPIAVDLAEADDMIAAIEAKNLKWAIGYNFRCTPLIAHLKKQLDEGLIGSVLELRGRGKEDNRAGGEDLVVLGTHVFDLMVHLQGGMPKWCMADITQNGEPATRADIRDASEPLGPVLGNRLHAVYGFDMGIAGHYSSMKSKDGAGGRWGLDIYGTRGIVTVRAEVAPVIYYLPEPSWAPGATGTAWQPIPGAPEFKLEDEVRERYKPIMDDLIEAIEEDRRPMASLHDGRNAHEMIQAVFASHLEGRRLSIPLEQRAHPLKA